MPNEVAKIARKFMRKPIEITVGTRNQATSTVQHEYYVVSGRHRYQALKTPRRCEPWYLLGSILPHQTRYSSSSRKTHWRRLQRCCPSRRFKSESTRFGDEIFPRTPNTNARRYRCRCRGIDVDDITHVIHYQLPDEIETYNHRSGRTGRAGKSGISMVILPKSEVKKIKTIEKMIGQPFEQKQLPSGMEICEIQLYHLANNLKNTEVNPAIDDYLPAIYKELKNVDRDELIKKNILSRVYAFLQLL